MSNLKKKQIIEWIFDRLFYDNWLAVSFESLDNKTIPRHLKYKIIVTSHEKNDKKLYRHIKYEIHGSELKDRIDLLSKYNYLSSGFAALQWTIDLSHISIISNTTLDEDIQVYEHRMPIPISEGFGRGDKLNILNRYNIILEIVFALFHFGLLIMLPVIVKRIVEERQTSITDYLFLMGVGKFEHWFSICVDAFSVIGLQNLIILILFSINSMKYTVVDELKWTSYLCGIDFSLFLFMIFLYILQSILFISFISVFFKNPQHSSDRNHIIMDTIHANCEPYRSLICNWLNWITIHRPNVMYITTVLHYTVWFLLCIDRFRSKQRVRRPLVQPLRNLDIFLIA